MTGTTGMAQASDVATASLPRPLDCAARFLRTGLGQLAGLLGIALLFRFPVFGEWNYEVDDQFYALVGQRMLDGATLYVDIWDRKGPVLYLIYAGVALISRSPIAWQLAATLFAALGAWGIAVMARTWTGPRAAFMGGVAYLAMLSRFEGAAGQAQVFYNTFMIAAAWAILSRVSRLESGRIDLRLALAMTSGGLAIATKQSAGLECIWFGSFCIFMLRRHGKSPAPRLAGQAAILALAGALPMLVIAAWYWHVGHFDALAGALVESNFSRSYDTLQERLLRLAALLGQMGFPLAFAALAVIPAGGWRTASLPVRFHLLWFAVAFLAVAAFPNIYAHYALPMMAPLCVLCAGFFEHRRGIAGLALGALVVVNLFYAGTFNLPERVHARAAMAQFEQWVHGETPERRLLVWGSPSFLYARIGALPPSPLAFPRHLFDGAEAGASGFDEVAVLRRFLATRPETVVVQDDLLASPLNQPNIDQVQVYLRTCGVSRRFTIYDHMGPMPQTVYSRCAGLAPRPASNGR